MVAATAGAKEAIFLACRRKTCCHGAWVVPAGRDIWRIARSLAAPPWSFLLYFEVPEARPDAFLLDGSGRWFRLALAKNPPRRAGAPAPCIFLLRTRSGEHRCGLGALRPAVCRAFPSSMAHGILHIPPDTGCTCRRWDLADVDIAEEVAAVTERERAGEEYAAVVARWNARVAESGPEARFTFQDFCTYVCGEYDRLAAGGDA